ncbi:PhzF family phenazine biosynthesis protein [Longimycelium tulufanense]|uniref:PhzF family phenazine biosynthesis protein n=1 Tax=Longimycelium tulufanense TaxID=907463 RepID=UPI00166A6DCA|nr:PhzF family phenazine biosynthesis protein [Longimycelium tulufanense]
MEIHVVDAFTDRAFAGNPAGVVLLREPATGAWMRSVAAEMKHAETAFVELDREVDGALPLRWFTPTTEVDLCGHATLATAHILGGTRRFHTRSGVLTCAVGADGWLSMDFPADPPAPVEPPSDLTGGLPGVRIQAVTRGVSDFLVEVASAAELRALRPDLAVLERLPVRGVIVTAPGDRADIDFVSRCFYPAAGVPEDDVTGSAHCTLACRWSDRLGRAELVGEQASPRGGIVRVARRGDRVVLAGRAVTVLSGTLHV